MPAMRVLGLDPGSRRTGWGVVDRSGNQFRCVEHGYIAPSARMDLPRRLHHLAREAGALIDRLAPAVVVVEEAFYHESVRSTLVLGHVRGALMVAAVERGVEIAEYTPREIKMAVVGNGGAAKEQVEFMVRRILGLPDPIQADAADALAGALCHLNRSQFAAVRAGSRSSKGFEALLARAAR